MSKPNGSEGVCQSVFLITNVLFPFPKCFFLLALSRQQIQIQNQCKIENERNAIRALQ